MEEEFTENNHIIIDENNDSMQFAQDEEFTGEISKELNMFMDSSSDSDEMEGKQNILMRQNPRNYDSEEENQNIIRQDF